MPSFLVEISPPVPEEKSLGVMVDGKFMPTLSVVIESTPGEQFTIQFDDQGGLLLKLRPEKSAFTMDLGGDAIGLAIAKLKRSPPREKISCQEKFVLS